MKETVLETVKVLSEIAGVSGDEAAVREAILRRVEDVARCRVDPLGNLLVEKPGARSPKNKLLFSAHMDEIGFIITHVEESGLLRFAPVGGIDSRVIVGKAVEVGEKRVYGLIGAKAIHQLEGKEKETPIKPDKLTIDIGAESGRQAEELVSPGDRAVFHAPFTPFGAGMIMGRAFDDRAGCALLVHLLRQDLPFDINVVFTVQEETGCAGAVTAAYTLEPDISVVVETTTASDIAGTPPDKAVCRLGAGPVLSFMDRGTVYDRELYRTAHAIARERSIPCQSKEGVFGGNESRSIQTARAGARTLAVSLPCRYIHSPSNVLQTGDLDSALALLRELVSGFGDL